ncbi:MAG: CoA ester lyase [Acetobacteraceae bacterium]
MLLRSILFVPALAERYIEKAPTLGADALVLDLEDSIAPSRKDDARAALASAAQRLARSGLPILVRVNHRADILQQDIEAAVRPEVCALKLPKIETADEVLVCAEMVARAEQKAGVPAGQTWLMPMIETPRGVLNADAIAASHARVQVIAFGVEDFAQSMRTRPIHSAMSMPAQMVAMAARANGLPALGLPGTVGEFTDLDAFRRTVLLARDLGFAGSGCIHPAQIAVLNETFGASAQELADARTVVSLYEAALARGQGAVAFEGRMIDIPIYERAVALLRDFGSLDGGA